MLFNQNCELIISVLRASSDTTQMEPAQSLWFSKAKIPTESSLQWRSPNRVPQNPGIDKKDTCIITCLKINSGKTPTCTCIKNNYENSRNCTCIRKLIPETFYLDCENFREDGISTDSNSKTKFSCRSCLRKGGILCGARHLASQGLGLFRLLAAAWRQTVMIANLHDSNLRSKWHPHKSRLGSASTTKTAPSAMLPPRNV